MKRYVVTLQQREREELAGITRKGSHRSQKVLNALILLNCDEASSTSAGRAGDHRRGLAHQCAQGRPSQEAIRGGRAGGGARRSTRAPARVCPQGRRRVRGAPGGVELRRTAGGPRAVVAAVAGRPGGGTRPHRQRVTRDRAPGSKKNELKPWKRVGWVIPPQHNADFAAAMEQVLDVYRRPFDPAFPVVCMDETPRQLISETREPTPAEPGRPARHDYQYRRCGTCNVFMAAEPLAGTRMTKVTERRTKADWARFLADIADRYPSATRITVVMDNLSTHRPAHCTRPTLRHRPRPCGIASSSSLPPSTAVGSTSPRTNSM